MYSSSKISFIFQFHNNRYTYGFMSVILVIGNQYLKRPVVVAYYNVLLTTEEQTVTPSFDTNTKVGTGFVKVSTMTVRQVLGSHKDKNIYSSF